MERSQILTERQQLELNKAILQYLQSQFPSDSNIPLIDQLQNKLLPNQSNGDIVDNYLEKKWSTVLRLQKKIIDLETELANLKTVFKQLNIDDNEESISLIKEKINWIPLTIKKSYKLTNAVNSITFHPSLPMIVNGCFDGSLYVWNLSNDEYQDDSIPEKIIKAHTRAVTKIVWSNEPISINNKNQKSYILATCSSDLTIKIWDENFKHVRTLSGHEHTISSVAFSHKNPTYLYSVSRDRTIKTWDLTTGLCVRSFIGHSEWVRDIDVVGGEYGDFVITCSNDQSARLSHPNSSTGIVMIIGHSHVIETLKFLPKLSNQIVDKYIMQNLENFPTLPADLIKHSSYNLLGYKYCITAGRDNLIKLWLLPPPMISPHNLPLPSKYNHSQAYHICDIAGHSSWIKSLHIHPNGRFIISSGDDKSIRIWDLNKLNDGGKVDVIRVLKGHEGFINDIEFARLKQTTSNQEMNGKELDTESNVKELEKRMRFLFISGGSDNTLLLWN